MREGKASERDPGKIAATGVLRLCSGLARRGGGERKGWGRRVSERERGGGERATERERLWVCGALGWRPRRWWAASGGELGRMAWPAQVFFLFVFLNNHKERKLNIE